MVNNNHQDRQSNSYCHRVLLDMSSSSCHMCEDNGSNLCYMNKGSSSHCQMHMDKSSHYSQVQLFGHSSQNLYSNYDDDRDVCLGFDDFAFWLQKGL